jgi:hypothetical protein
MEEIWRVIPEYEIYEASNLGNIRNAKNERLVKQSLDTRGYKVVKIYQRKKKCTKKVARMVWAAFNGCQCGLTIDHLDHDKINNHISNLDCVSMADNRKNRDIYSYNNKSNKYNLTTELKAEIGLKLHTGELNLRQVWLKYGIPSNYTSSVKKRGNWLRLNNLDDRL